MKDLKCALDIKAMPPLISLVTVLILKFRFELLTAHETDGTKNKKLTRVTM